MFEKNISELKDAAVLEGANFADLANLTLEELKYLYGPKLQSVLLACGITFSSLIIAGCAGGEGGTVQERGILYRITGISDVGVLGARLDLVDASADPNKLEDMFAPSTSCYVADGSKYSVGQELYKQDCK